MTVEQIADITKLRTDHVRALEEGNYSFFAAPVYVRGFVRTYATLLKLDLPEVMRDLDHELGQDPNEPPRAGAASSVPLQFSTINWRRGMLFLAVVGVASLAAIAWFSYQRYRQADPLQELKPGIYEPANGQAGETLPLPRKADGRKSP